MEIFAITCLFVIILALQHFVNYMIRLAVDNYDFTVPGVVLIVISLALTLGLCIRIVIWSHQINI